MFSADRKSTLNTAAISDQTLSTAFCGVDQTETFLKTRTDYYLDI